MKNAMNNDAQIAGRWIIVLVAYDDPEVLPQVIKERIGDDDDEELAAFLRGGELVDVISAESETVAEGYRAQVEKSCLR